MAVVDAVGGLIRSDWPALDDFVAVTDPGTASLPAAAGFLARPRVAHVVTGRPTLDEAHAISRALSQSPDPIVIGIGSGVALDTAKLGAWVHADNHPKPKVLAIPCGPEPYRAVTGFSMYDDQPGSRKGIYEDWFRASSIHVIPELLEEMDAATVALFCGDSLVHAIESLLSKLTAPQSEPHSRRAASIFVREAFVNRPDRALLVEASIRAAVAFEITKLGLAHALSRPMGIAAGCSHDMFNLMLGPAVVRYWGDQVLGESALATDVGLEPRANLWSELLEHYQAAAGLPRTLAETTLTRKDIQKALEWAPNSSGIPNLPHPLGDGDLDRIVAAAWGSEGSLE